MASSYPIQSTTSTAAATTEHQAILTTHTTLKYLLAIVPIVAGADKFTNILAQWEVYLNPMFLSIVPVSAATFMRLVGVIEIVAGVLVFLRPRLGAFVVMAWLLAIAGQLLVWGRFLDIAVRDIVIAVGSALTLARLTIFVERSKEDTGS